MKELDEIRAKLTVLAAKIAELTVRERLLMMFTIIAAISMLWHTMFMAPLTLRADQSRVDLSAINERIAVANTSLQEQVLQLTAGSTQDRARIAMLQKRIEEINSTLGNYLGELIDPGEMAELLEGVLREHSSISMVRIGNIPPEILSASEKENATILYRHGLEIEVEATFAACLEYLEAIESLPWRLYWQVLDLEVIDYPLNRIRIEVSTLSLNEEWIGA